MIIGTGVDITEVRRLKQAVQKWGNDFLNRIFTETELEQAKKRGTSIYQHLAGRFAAKEAVFKAFNDKHLGWKDFQILNDQAGRPYCEFLNKKFAKFDIQISISHVKTYAVANCVITKKA